MNPDFHPIVNGTYLLLAIQLLVVAGLQFFYSSKKQYALAFLGLIISMWFFRRFFWDIWSQHPLLILLIGGYKEVFIGPLLLFHLRMKWKNISAKTVMLHLAIPIILYLRYVISRIFFPEFYEETKLIGFWSLLIFLNLSYWFYFLFGIYELRNKLKPLLLPRIYRRTRLFFIAFFTYHLLAITATLLSSIAVRLKSTSEFWVYLNDTIIYNFHWYLQIPLLLMVSIFLIVYSLSETPYFKKIFATKKIHVETTPPELLSSVSELISEKFYKEKVFADPELSLEKTVVTLNISKKDMGTYLAHNGYSNFSEFINKLRVNEFKRLVEKRENQKYDLISIAYMAGFKSKATFYRVFKQIEGITPSQYLKSR